MSTYTQILYQIVFSTKGREKVLIKEKRQQMFKYIWGILENKKCHLYRINAVEDHIHIVTHIHPSIALADLVKDIKSYSSHWVRENKIFPEFTFWQEGYAAFTYSYDSKDNLIVYVKNQELHHKKRSFRDELIELLNEHNVEFDEKYLL